MERASREVGIYALTLDAIDEEARNWYLGLRFGFQELTDSLDHLCLPIETIRSLLSGGSGNAAKPSGGA